MQANGPVEDLFRKLDDTRFHLLVFGQPLPAEGMPDAGGLMQAHVIPDDPANQAELTRAKIPRRSFYLLRQDGHVGVCGIDADTAAITRYIKGPLCLR